MKIAGNHYAAQSLIFGFPDPEKVPDKKPMPFDKEHPFQNLGIRLISDKGGGAGRSSLSVRDIELTSHEFSEINGIQQILKEPAL